MRGEQLGHAAAVGGRVDVQDPRARSGSASSRMRSTRRADDVGVVGEVLVEQRDAFEQRVLPEATAAERRPG